MKVKSIMDERKLFEVEDYVLQEVLKAFDRTEKSLDDDAERLKEWFKTQPHLPEVMDKERIKNFLILNKCSIEKAKSKIDMYYTIRTLLPDIFNNSNPKLPIMKKVVEAVYFVYLPKLTKEMYRVYILKTRDTNVLDDLDPYNIMAYMVNANEIRLKEDITFGDILVIDFANVGFKYLTKFTPVKLHAAFVQIYERVFSLRIKGLYIINVPPIVEKLVMSLVVLTKKIINPKIAQRIHVSQNANIIKEKFPKEIIPKDYGGDEKPFEELQDILVSKFNQYQERFDQLDTLRVDESLRPEKLENNEYLGFYGNFKKLEID